MDLSDGMRYSVYTFVCPARFLPFILFLLDSHKKKKLKKYTIMIRGRLVKKMNAGIFQDDVHVSNVKLCKVILTI